MQYLVNADHNSMAAHLTRSECEGFFKKCCMSNAVDGTDDVMLWNGREGGGNLRSQCEEDEGTDCEDGDSDTDW